MPSEQIQGFGGDEALRNVDALLQEIDDNLSRTHGTTGIIVTDKQTQRILRVLRILRDELASRTANPGDNDDSMGGGIQVFDPNDRPWEQ